MDDKLLQLLDKYKAFSQVKAIAIGGSSAAKTLDDASDIDVYVFVTSDIDISCRKKIVEEVSSKYEVGGEYFGAGDEFLVDDIGVQLDVMYWNCNWFEGIVDSVWNKYHPSNGYTTCFLYTLSVFDIVYDTDNWLNNLQKSIKTAYPSVLKENIIKRNMMLMYDKPFASYYEQIKKAIKRDDLNSVNHRISAFMASYFDVIFALNSMLHPGEKRLLKYSIDNCKILPVDYELNINKLFNSKGNEVVEVLEIMVKNLKSLIKDC